MTKQAILMRDWADNLGDEWRLYRLTVALSYETRRLFTVGVSTSRSDWLGVVMFSEGKGIWHPYFSDESGAMLGWAASAGYGTTAEVLARLGYEEVVP